jgi:hypothetical protein
MKNVKYVILAVVSAVILMGIIGVRFSASPSGTTEQTVSQSDSDTETAPTNFYTEESDSSAEALRQYQAQHSSERSINNTKPVSLFLFPIEESPMAPADTNELMMANLAFNQAADVLQKLLNKLDKSQILASLDGTYALAICGKTYIVASSDGSHVIFQQGADGQKFETSSGTLCTFIAQKDNYYLAKLAPGAYILTTPAGKEYTLSGAQNSEDKRRQFTSNPDAAATISALAKLQNELPEDHDLYTSPDKKWAVVTTSEKYIVIDPDGNRRDLATFGTSDYFFENGGMTCVAKAGDTTMGIGQPTPDTISLKKASDTNPAPTSEQPDNSHQDPPILAKNPDDTQTVPGTYGDPNAIPPEDPNEFFPAQLRYPSNLLTKNEWELSLSERRERNRLLAAQASGANSSSL